MSVDARLPAAVIFDMDGVLIDSEPLHAESYVQAFTEMGLAITLDDYNREVSIGHLSVSELYAAVGGDMTYWHDVSARKAVLTKELMSQKGALLPGVITLLESLNDAGIPTALATSAGKRSLGIFMEKFDLRSYFEHILTWEDVNAIKPDPKAYIVSAERLGVRPEHCAVLEDSPRGVLAARRAGMKCIAIPNDSTRHGDFSPASLVVGSLEEVSLQLIRSLF
ncbi:MAG: HAD-IA family hydrolase [Armatimonadetes bacterium]|nr:HAD-IA family hydrolase [Armatimonadota bacterium]